MNGKTKVTFTQYSTLGKKEVKKDYVGYIDGYVNGYGENGDTIFALVVCGEEVRWIDVECLKVINKFTLLKNKFKYKMSVKKEKVFNCYIKNPGITYKKASELLGINPSAIYQHISSLEKMGYIEKDNSGGVIIKKYY